MGTVSSYNLAAVQSALGGSNPISMSEYYRGGSYVPTTTTSTVTQNSTFRYNSYPRYFWNVEYMDGYEGASSGTSTTWANVQVWMIGLNTSLTSYTSGGYTYYRGTLRVQINFDYGRYSKYYEVYRTYVSTTSINTSVPSSGTISLSQLYGARNP